MIKHGKALHSQKTSNVFFSLEVASAYLSKKWNLQAARDTPLCHPPREYEVIPGPQEVDDGMEWNGIRYSRPFVTNISGCKRGGLQLARTCLSGLTWFMRVDAVVCIIPR